MQIIQSLLGSQVNPLGQKTYLGYQHKISSQENNNAPRYRHNNFIKPLVLSKPIFTPSKFLLARKRQPLIDTLMADGYDLDILDMDTESSVTEIENFNSISEVNNSDKLIDMFDISKVSTSLQTQIADEISNDILTETSIQQKAPTNRTPKAQTKSANKSKAKKSSKSSTPRRKTPIIDQASTIPKTTETLLTTDNLPAVTDNTSAIQHINFHNPAINLGETEIANVNLADDLILSIKPPNNESQVIPEPSNSTDVFSAAANGENEELLNQNSEIDIDTSNLIGDSTVEAESTNSIANINKANRFTSQLPHLAHETAQNIDSLDISDSPNYSPAETDSPNILQPNTEIKINEVLPTSVSPKIAESLLHHQNIPDEIIEEPSNTVLETTQNASSLSDVNASNSAETISPKMEHKTNLFMQLASNDDQPIVADESYFATETEAVNEVIASENRENTINKSQRLDLDNLTTEPVNTEAVELTSTSPIIDSQTNLFETPEEVTESKQAINTSDITSINSAVNQKYPIAKDATIQPDSTSTTASGIAETQRTELTAITPVDTSPQSAEVATPELINIQPKITSNTAPEIEETQPTELATITPVDTSTVSPQAAEVATPELTNIQPKTSATAPEIAETQPTELAEITPVATSTLSPKSEEETTSELTNIQPDSTSTIATEIAETQPTELAEIQPVATSTVSPKSEEETTSELTNIQPDSTSNTAPEIAETQPTELAEIQPVATSTVSPQSEEVATPELTNIQSKITSATTPEIEENQSTELAEIQPVVPTQDANIIKPDTADIPLVDVTGKLPILPNVTNNEQAIPSQSSLVFNNLDLSNANTLDISEDTSSANNVDIEPAAILNNLPAPKGYATGGQVTATSVENHQPVAPSDTVPAMLTPGEFVINAQDAQRNLQILQHINTGGSPEEVISPSLEVTAVQKQESNSLPSTTLVDSFGKTPLQRQSAETDTFPEPTPLSSPSLGVEVGKQRRSLLNHPHIDTMENTADVSPSSPHYSSPSLIFRKTHSTPNSQTPSQWSSVEELLNSHHDDLTNFNFGGNENNWQNSPSSQFASSSTPSQIFAKRLPSPQGFANGGEVIAPDISRDIAPVTETIQNPHASSPTEGNDDKDDEKLEALAQEIYYRLRQRIEIEKERQGIYVGRLPW